MPQRVLSEAEFNAIKAKVLAEAPDGLSEQDFYQWAGPRMAAAVGEAESLPAPAEGNAFGRFVSGAAEMLNPVELVKGVAGAVRHPLDTAKAVVTAQGEQFGKAADRFREGRIAEGIGHGVAGVVPLLGPAAAEAGEQIGSGDVAGGLGKGAGLLVPTTLPSVARAVKAGVPGRVRGALAEGLERGAARRLEQVIAPVTGKNKANWVAKAKTIAPKLADEGIGAWSERGLAKKVDARFADVTANLDAALDAVLGSKMVKTRAIAREIQAELDKLTVKGIKGESFIPEPSRARAAALQSSLDEVNRLGPLANFQAVRKLRMAWDGQAAQGKIYAQSAADFATKEAAHAAGDSAGAMRRALAASEPRVATANADWSLMKSVRDVLAAKAEAESARAGQFPRTVARAGGAVAGVHAGGNAGAAIAGALVADTVESVARSGATTKIQAARIMTKMAKAVRSNQTVYVRGLSAQLKALSKRAAAQGVVLTGRATNPSGFQTRTEPAR